MLVLAAAVVGALLWKQQSDKSGNKNPDETNNTQNNQGGPGAQVVGPPKTEVERQLDAITYESGNTTTPEAKQQTLEKYDALADQVTDKQVKQDVLLAKASFALDAKFYTNALEAAKQAEALVPNAASSQMIAITAAAQGDKEAAVKYYKETINRYDKKSPLYESEVNYIKQQITDLGGTL